MVSIILPARYRADLTRVCIDSIINYTQDYELILVQEGEDEEIERLLKSYLVYPQQVREAWKSKGVEHIGVDREAIKYIQQSPKGYAGALNAGMKVATGDLYCFMNNDTVATPGWMDEMLKGFDDPNVGLVGPTMWGMGNRQSVDWNGKMANLDYILEPFSLAGVCFLISRQCMEALDDPKYPGQWDEDFNHGGEDFDIVLRIRNANYAMVVARKSFIYHYGGASTRIYIGDDLQVVQKHHYDMMMKLIKKHGLKEEEVFSRLNK